ncbi:sigma-70 family RNA polymerase sigma factor [Allopusillimonas ginsengisoli]|nr:sigma-70 family RNA polymerase sigma factor [Allopusillimonas ginsengisoli]
MSRSPMFSKGWLAHYSELVNTWAKRSSSRHDAEDAAHDSIAQWLAMDASAIDNPRSYLHRSVRNRLTDQHRRSQVLDVVAFDELPEEDHPLLTDPDAHVRTAQLLASLKEALAELPLKCRQVFLWHRLEGYTQQEVAQRLGISVSMVEKYMIKAARHLRNRLQQYDPH